MPNGVCKHDWLMRWGLALLLIVVSISCQAKAASLEQALDAMAGGDYYQGVTMLKPLARKGNSEAQYLLGRAYSHGEGVDPNPRKAIKWLERAAEQLHYGAANTLGKMYASGMGVPIDAGLAAKWFERAAEISDATTGEHADCIEP